MPTEHIGQAAHVEPAGQVAQVLPVAATVPTCTVAITGVATRLPLKARLAALTGGALLICALPMLANLGPRLLAADSVDTELSAFDDMRDRASQAEQVAADAAIRVEDAAAAVAAVPVLANRTSPALTVSDKPAQAGAATRQALPRSFATTAPPFSALLTRIDSKLWRDKADETRQPGETSAATAAHLPGLAGVDFPSVLGGDAGDRTSGTVYQRWEPMVSWRTSTHDDEVEHPIARVHCMGLSPQAVAKRADPYEKLIVDLAIGQGISASLVKAVVTKESCFNPKAVSKAGATGLMQLMPATARWLKAGDVGIPENNLRTGVKYLASLRKRFGSDELALAAYNAGPGNVERHGGIPPFAETRRYVEDVMANYRRYVAVNRLSAR